MKTMKYIGCLWVAGILCAVPAPAPAQTAPFTRITTGPIVSDGGDSFISNWADYDEDGDIDLVIGNGFAPPDFCSMPAQPFLYLNPGNGNFRRATTEDIGGLATDALYGGHVIWGDYNNDGYLDLFMKSLWQPCRLYQGNGDGTFTRIMEDVGVNGSWSELSGPWGSSWVDFDQDGFLDMFVVVAWSQDGTYCGRPFYRSVDRLYRNNRDGTFSLALTNVFNKFVNSVYSSWCDYDNDGDPDLYLGIWGGFGSSLFYRNEGGGQMMEILGNSVPRGDYHGAWADYDNDGDMDLCARALFRNNGDGAFSQEAAGPSGGPLQLWGDYDNDGFVDLFVAMGEDGAQVDRLWRNNGNGTFTQITSGSLVTDFGRHQGAAWGDYDNDGALDLVVTAVANANNRLYHNDGNTNSWILLRLKGTLSNRAAIGTKVRTEAVIRGQVFRQMRQVDGGSTQCDLRVHFGLGDATNITTLRLEWPSGIVQEFPDVSPRQILPVTEPAIGVEPRTAAPPPGSSITLSVVWSNAAPTSYQWRRNGSILPGATSATLELTDIQPSQTGRYTVEMVDGLHRVISQPVVVTVYPVITRQPQSLTVTNDNPATFSVVATSPWPPLTYQWRFNGLPLANETNDTLTIPSAQAEHAGLYDVEVADALASVLSEPPARLTVLFRPNITQLVTNYTVVQGGTAILSVECTGTLPMSYRWRSNNTALKMETLDAHQSFLVLPNVQPRMSGPTNRYTVILTNAVFSTPGVLSPNIYLTVLPDTDGDGMDDYWETNYPTCTEPDGDADKDGLTNLEEYLAGTDCTDPTSYLKVERIAVNGEAQIEFKAAANLTYTVQYTEDLDAPVWHTLADVVAGPARTVVLTDPASTAQRFYRLATPRQP